MPVKKTTTTRASTLDEEQKFYADDETTSAGKNRRLASLTSGPLLNKHLVSVKRIEIGPKCGWLFLIRS